VVKAKQQKLAISGPLCGKSNARRFAVADGKMAQVEKIGK